MPRAALSVIMVAMLRSSWPCFACSSSFGLCSIFCIICREHRESVATVVEIRPLFSQTCTARIQKFPDGSGSPQMFPDVSRCFQMCPEVSRGV
eukprot:jgi/Chrzof1/5184/Cz15g15080.t1